MSKDYDTKEVSKCCRAGIHRDYRENWESETTRCNKCNGECEVEEVCEYCDGTGFADALEPVYQGEPHLAPIGTQPCICNESYWDDDPYGGDGQDD